MMNENYRGAPSIRPPATVKYLHAYQPSMHLRSSSHLNAEAVLWPEPSYVL